MPNVLEKPASLFRAFLDVMLPPVCYVCQNSCSGKYGLCDTCLEKIRPIPPPFCHKCGRRFSASAPVCGECSMKKSYVERAWSCCYFEGILKDCVHLFKYRGYIGLVDIFGDIMAGFAIKNGIRKEADLIVPVPIHSSKRRERSYNHAEVLARALSKRLDIPMDARNLKKIRWTRSQSELDKEERLTNVKDSFLVVDKRAFFGGNILLVDDVYTTGATVNECSRVLLDTKAKNIFSLTLARGV